MNTLTGISAPPGTLLGPGRYGRVMVVVEDLGDRVTVDYATPEQVRAGVVREDRCSVTEVRMHRQRLVKATSDAATAPVREAIEAMARKAALAAPAAPARRPRRSR